jgi:hypothetical protein
VITCNYRTFKYVFASNTKSEVVEGVLATPRGQGHGSNSTLPVPGPVRTARDRPSLPIIDAGRYPVPNLGQQLLQGTCCMALHTCCLALVTLAPTPACPGSPACSAAHRTRCRTSHHVSAERFRRDTDRSGRKVLTRQWQAPPGQAPQPAFRPWSRRGSRSCSSPLRASWRRQLPCNPSFSQRMTQTRSGPSSSFP